MTPNRIASTAWRTRGRAAAVALTALALGACGSSQKTQTTTGDGSSTADAPPPEPVLLPVAGDPSVSYSVWFQVGSQNDPPGKEGLAWLTGRLIAEGSTQNNSYPEIINALFPMAASYDVRVDREMTTLSGRAHKDHTAPFMALLSDAYLRPAFADDDIERLRNQGLNYLEKTLRYASDEELGKAALRSFVFADTPYAHPVVGTVAGLKAITAEDVRNFYATYYTQDRTVFALGGGYDQATIDAVQATRSELPPASGATQAPEITPAAITGRQVLIVDKPGADASISMGFPIDVQRGDEDFYPLWLATSWLGEHRNSSSHLYQVIRAARGLNYGDYAYIEDFPEGGSRQMPPTNVAKREQMFEIWIRTLPNDNAVFAMRAALRELRMLVDEGMTAEEFELMRNFLRGYLRQYAPTTQTKLGYAIDDRFYRLEHSHLERFIQELDSLTLERVNAALKKHLQLENIKIAIVTGAREQLTQEITSGAPSQISYPTEKPDSVLAEDKLIVQEPLNIPAANIRSVAVDEIFEN